MADAENSSREYMHQWQRIIMNMLNKLNKLLTGELKRMAMSGKAHLLSDYGFVKWAIRRDGPTKGVCQTKETSLLAALCCREKMLDAGVVCAIAKVDEFGGIETKITNLHHFSKNNPFYNDIEKIAKILNKMPGSKDQAKAMADLEIATEKLNKDINEAKAGMKDIKKASQREQMFAWIQGAEEWQKALTEEDATKGRYVVVANHSHHQQMGKVLKDTCDYLGKYIVKANQTRPKKNVRLDDEDKQAQERARNEKGKFVPENIRQCADVPLGEVKSVTETKRVTKEISVEEFCSIKPHLDALHEQTKADKDKAKFHYAARYNPETDKVELSHGVRFEDDIKSLTPDARVIEVTGDTLSEEPRFKADRHQNSIGMLDRNEVLDVCRRLADKGIPYAVEEKDDNVTEISWSDGDSPKVVNILQDLRYELNEQRKADLGFKAEGKVMNMTDVLDKNKNEATISDSFINALDKGEDLDMDV